MTYVDTCWHLLAIQVRFSGSLVVTTTCCAARGWNLPPLRHHWTYTSWRLAAASIDSLPYSAWVTIYFSPILYTQWQWRNFVPYLCQLIFAAISFVNFGTKKRIRMELFAMAHVYTQDRPSPLIGIVLIQQLLSTHLLCYWHRVLFFQPILLVDVV